jgi:glycerol uptake facilitator-like aquaporin
MPSTIQLKAFFVVFGIVFTTVGYWLKQIIGAIAAVLAVFGLYLYATGFFYRHF